MRVSSESAVTPFDAGARPAVVVTRGGIVESEHFVRYAVAGPDGTVHESVGDIAGSTFMRSSAKPLICTVVVQSGAADRFGLSDEELAVAAGSHSGEPRHIQAVRSIFHKIGLDESALECGAHPPIHEPSAKALAAEDLEPGRIHNNCSGKHAAIMALAVLRGVDPAGYTAPDHPAQVEILSGCAELLGVERASFVIGIDGCGIPVIAVPLRAAAACYARFADPERFGPRWSSAAARVRDAMLSHPFYVAGTGRFDTDLMKATSRTIFCKGGAEGYHASTSLEKILGVCVKVADGNYRAVSPFVLGKLTNLGAIDQRAAGALRNHLRPKVKNYSGTVVGEIRAI